MLFNPIGVAVLVFVSCTFLACQGQVKTEIELSEERARGMGQVVLKLDNRIWSVFQDSKGHYWFGSNGKGVYHYDSETLRLITTDDGLIDNAIRGIQEDNRGNIFIETPEGVSKFDGDQFSTLRVIRSEENEWKLEPNDLWFNCNGSANHVYRYDGEHLYALQLPKKDLKNLLGIDENEIPYSPYSVYGIDKDKDGNIWFGTVLAGAFRFDGESFLWIGERELSRLEDGREPGVRSIIQDADGYFWLSNFKSKYRINPDSLTYTRTKAVEIDEEVEKDKLLYFNAGISDSHGDIWMISYGGGVWKYDGKTLTNAEINNGAEEVLLISIHRDNDGVIWLGTDNDGAYRNVGASFEKFELK